MNNDNELQQMKLQLHSLKQEIEQNTTLHEDTLRKQLKKGGTALYKRERASIIFVAIVTLLLPPILYLQGMSLWLCGFTLVFFVFALAWEIYYFKNLQLGHLQECDLITTEINMQKYRRLNRIWLFYIGLPFIFGWAGWYFYEQVQYLESVSGEALSTTKIVLIIVSGIIGGVIGGLIGYFKFYKPQMKQAQEIIDQIKEIEENN